MRALTSSPRQARVKWARKRYWARSARSSNTHKGAGARCSQGVVRGGRGHHWPKLGHRLATPLATPLKMAVLVPFFSWQEIHLLRRGTAVSLYDHIKREIFQTRTSASPQCQAQVKRAWKETGTKWASVEQQWTAVWWDAVRLYISKTNFPVLSAVTVLTAHTLQLYANIRRTQCTYTRKMFCFYFLICKVQTKMKSFKCIK